MVKKYFELSPNNILKDIEQTCLKHKIMIRGIELWIYPNVYPSDRFRPKFATAMRK